MNLIEAQKSLSKMLQNVAKDEPIEIKTLIANFNNAMRKNDLKKVKELEQKIKEYYDSSNK